MSPTPGDPLVDAALARAVGALAGSEDRPSQRMMAQAVASAASERRHLIVQAGTGTGKSLAYLVPALALGLRTVVSTATKALQDQLATRDLPTLAASLGVPVEYAVLKGRSNYACLQRVAEISGGGEQLSLDRPGGGGEVDAGLGRFGREVRRLVRWAQSGTETGDRAELPFEPSDAAWAQVSVAARECPGASRCPSGGQCFAEKARQRAAVADVVVVNTHLYATALAVGAELLPDHDLVVFDEAHELEDIASSAFGFELSPGRFAALGRSARPLLFDNAPAVAVEDSATILADLARPYLGRALPRPLRQEDQDRLVTVRERLARLQAAIRKDERAETDDARRARTLQSLLHLLRDVDWVMNLTGADVAWAEGSETAPLLRVAPLDVGAALTERLWSKEEGPTAVLTSATIPPRLGERLALPAGSYDQLDVGSPYAYDEQALLYCPVHLPDPRDEKFEAAMHDELVALIEAAGGRTLGLFTSWRAMKAAAEAVRGRIGWDVLTQSDLPKPALVARFSSDEQSCLFATMGFWQGVDVPGRSLSLVTIDRLPFPRPDDPLLQARRARYGTKAFELIDIPRAAALLAQGTGRLIRSRSDRGVVAVFDNRLAKARYRWTLVNALPPMRRTRHRAEVEGFLRALSSPAAPAPSAGSASSGPP
ncbi:MAG TPA: ATP-dependent DNA helicase [Acidimicrobiales bacterium]|nr:ATP-dependent DNA helicase [Acidimicrobiales bacterium]